MSNAGVVSSSLTWSNAIFSWLLQWTMLWGPPKKPRLRHSPQGGSNSRPLVYKTSALTTELWRPNRLSNELLAFFFILIQHLNRQATNWPAKRTCQSCAVVAEWLRRWTWNPMGSPRAGSNPAGCDKSFWHLQGVKIQSKNYLPPVRFELTTPGLRDQCSTTELKRLSWVWTRSNKFFKHAMLDIH